MDRAQCIALLQKKQQELVLQEQHRLPCRGDFSREEVCAVKAQLGPWPRALEEAGLKPRKFDPEQQALLKKEKRIAAKRKRNAARNLKVPKAPAPDRDACGEPLADI